MISGSKTSEETGVGVGSDDGGVAEGASSLYEGGRGCSSGRTMVASVTSGAEGLGSVAAADGAASDIDSDGGGVSGRGGGGPRGLTSAASPSGIEMESGDATRAVGDTTMPGVSSKMFGGTIFLEDARARSSSSVSSLIRGSLDSPSEIT